MLLNCIFRCIRQDTQAGTLCSCHGGTLGMFTVQERQHCPAEEPQLLRNIPCSCWVFPGCQHVSHDHGHRLNHNDMNWTGCYLACSRIGSCVLDNAVNNPRTAPQLPCMHAPVSGAYGRATCGVQAKLLLFKLHCFYSIRALPLQVQHGPGRSVRTPDAHKAQIQVPFNTAKDG
jgi:hypothetical protein